MEYPDWALALAITDDGHAVMVEQYRYAIDRTTIEFAAGAVHAGEDPLLAAKRELVEETGYAAERWTHLGRLAVEPARHTNFAHLFVAEGASRVAEPELDSTEDLRLHLVPAARLATLVESGDILHGIHAAAVMWAASRGLVGGHHG